MAIDIQFYTFGKKINSTAIPSNPDYTASCELREGTDQLNPQILLNYTNPVAFNYARIEAFSRYYFINSWTWESGIWVGSLTVDPLASWKNTIRAYSQFVLRSESSSNPYVVEGAYPIQTNPTISIQTFNYNTSDQFYFYDSDNSMNTGFHFVVKAIFGSPGEGGYSAGLQLLLMNGYAFYDFMSEIANLPDFSEIITNCLVNITWYPFDISQKIPFTGQSNFKVQFPGNKSFVLSDSRSRAGMIGSNQKFIELNWSIDIPQYDTNTQYLNTPPFLTASILFYPYGTFQVNTQKFFPYNGTVNLSSRVNLDVNNSVLSYKFVDSAGLPSYEPILTMPLGSSIPFSTGVSNSLRSGFQMTNNVIDTIGSLFARDFKGTLTGLQDSISTAMSGFVPTVQIQGGTDSAIVDIAPRMATQKLIIDTAPSKLGNPLYKYVALNTLTGFCQCMNASLPLTCTEIEHEQILQYMNGGFYLE
jgi:hypothetical protein